MDKTGQSVRWESEDTDISSLEDRVYLPDIEQDKTRGSSLESNINTFSEMPNL